MTNVQFRVLDNLDLGNEPFCHIRGVSAHGGAAITLLALIKRGWIDDDHKMTDEGEKAYRKERLYRQISYLEGNV